MKITNVTPGLIAIPPNGWGAVEKIIWENHCNFIKAGEESSIKYLNDLNLLEDVVFIHVANLANMAQERGIPYYFMMHDHHSYLYGKNSNLYKENLKAIKNAIKAFVPAKYLVEYFDNIPEYFSHGVNTDFFNFQTRKNNAGHRLLCVANNGYAENKNADRKGFDLAIKMAKHFDLPITIAGPKNNVNFFQAFPQDYNKLNILYDLNENDLLECYRNHSIFIHMSELEAGHPNMTLLEALACGLPVVGTLEDKLSGMEVVKRDLQSGIAGLQKVLNYYETYQKDGLESAQRLSWKNRSLELLQIFKSNKMNFTKKLDQAVKSVKKISYDQDQDFLLKKGLRPSDFPNFSFAKTNGIINYKNKITINYNFCDGAFVEILGNIDQQFQILFINKKNSSVLYSTFIKPNHWAKCNKCHYLDYKIVVKKDGSDIFSHEFDLAKRKVYISLDTRSLGDHLAWVPYVEEFRKKHNCEVYCATFLNHLFKDTYPSIKFINHGDKNNYEFYATYNLGYFFKNLDARTKHPSSITLQEVACDILGLEYKEVKPKLNIINKGNKFKKPYVCIATQSTSQAKYWNNPEGWNKVVDYLQSKGFDVVCIDKHRTFGTNEYFNTIPKKVIDKTGDLPLEDRINDLLNCEFFIGLGSGLSWLAWACNKPVIMISGFSNPISEFFTPHRVHNPNVCNSCWNDTEENFNLSDWENCPRKKNFECSKEISFEMVKDKIDKLL